MSSPNVVTQSYPIRRFAPRRYRPGDLGNWSGHLSFACDLIAALRPRLLVELGTHYGESYFGLCQAVEESGIACKCFAVDTWKGDAHAGAYDEAVFEEVNRYNSENYARFSTLLRTTFDAAAEHFSDGSIDLLHLDGLHTYEAVRRDFYSWLPKLRPGGVVLLHDTAVRHADFGVWRLWEEVRGGFLHFEFFHSWGLGVVQIPGGANAPGFLKTLFEGDEHTQSFLRQYYETQAENLDFRHRGELAVPGSAKTRLTVYPCLHDGYSEATAVSIEMQQGVWYRHSVILNDGASHGPMRVDPAECACIIELKQISINRAGNGGKVAEWTGPALAQFNLANDLITLTAGPLWQYLSTGPDPQILLPMLPPEIASQPLIVEIWVRILFDLRSLSAPLTPTRLVAENMEIALKKSREEAMEMARQRDEALTQNRQLQGDLTEVRAEVRSHQAERLALIADQRYKQARLERRLHEVEALGAQTRTTVEKHLQEERAASAKIRSELEDERNRVTDLLNSYSWRITGSLRRIYEMSNALRRPKP